MSLHWTNVETRHGTYHVASRNGKIVTIKLPGTEVSELWQTLGNLFPGEEPMAGMDPVLGDAAIQLQEFSEGIRHEFSLPFEMHGTEFQKQVWGALMDIPYGETRSYGDIAQAIGNPGAVRAVGGANRANNLAPVVPCHRVIAANGGLGGYMGQWGEGGSLGLKAALLDLERRGAPFTEPA